MSLPWWRRLFCGLALASLLAACGTGKPAGGGPGGSPSPGASPGASASAGVSGTASATVQPSGGASASPRPSAGGSPSPRPSPVASASPRPVAGSEVRGTITAGPTCPVERIDSPCPPQPVVAMVTARSASGAVAGTTESDAQGSFALALPAGTYTLSADPGSTFPRCSTIQVSVAPGQVTSAYISCDTGIR